MVVVGGQVIGSMLRCSTDGRMQSNCFLGKMGEGLKGSDLTGPCGLLSEHVPTPTPVSDLLLIVDLTGSQGLGQKTQSWGSRH